MLLTKRYELFLIPPLAVLRQEVGKPFGKYTFSPCKCGCALSWGHGYLFGLIGLAVHDRWLSDEVIRAWRDGGELVVTE